MYICLLYGVSLTVIKNRLVVAKEVSREGMHSEFWVSRCKLVYIEWINNQILPYGPGNYIQYPVINHNGKDYKK